MPSTLFYQGALRREMHKGGEGSRRGGAQPCSASRLLPAYAHNDDYNSTRWRTPLLGFQGVEADYVLKDLRQGPQLSPKHPDC